jgi:hypothetical protein
MNNTVTTFITIQTYNYNTTTKTITKPETITINKHNIVRIEPFRRPKDNKEEYYEATLTDRHTMIIDAIDKEQITE